MMAKLAKGVQVRTQRKGRPSRTGFVIKSLPPSPVIVRGYDNYLIGFGERHQEKYEIQNTQWFRANELCVASAVDRLANLGGQA